MQLRESVRKEFQKLPEHERAILEDAVQHDIKRCFTSSQDAATARALREAAGGASALQALLSSDSCTQVVPVDI